MEEDSEETRRRLQFEGVLVGVSSGPDGNAPESEPPAPPLPPQYVKDKDRTKLRKKMQQLLEIHWHHWRPPSRRTARPNEYHRLERPGTGATRDRSRARLSCTDL
jgi:hypothetical protein